MAGPSSYSSGFSNGITLQQTPISIPHPGKVFWVNNSSVLSEGGIGGSNTNPGTYKQPFSTLDYAVGRCTAGRGDVIYIMPGYAQSLTTADGVDVDVADVRIIGLGRGLKRPRFTYDLAAGEFVIGAANVRIENLVFVPSVTAITHAVDVEAAATDVQIVNCSFETGESDTVDEFLICIEVAVLAARGLIQGCYINQGAAGAATGISLATPIDWEIRDNFIMGDFSVACLGTITGAGVRCRLISNIIISGLPGDLGTVAGAIFTQSAAGTWTVADNYVASNDGTSFVAMFTNYSSTINLGNRYTDDSTMALSAVDRSTSIPVGADA